MIRYAVLIFNMLGLFFYQLFNQDAITVKQSAPPEVKPGTEYTIELTINKGTTGGFAKLQQDLPEGFTAEAGDSKGASFSFSGTSVKYSWTSLPSEPEFKISYKVKAAASVPAGEKELTGKFFYVADNNKQSVDITPVTIKVMGDAVATNTNNTTNTTMAANNTGKPVKDSSAAINAVTEALGEATGNNTTTTTNTATGITTITTNTVNATTANTSGTETNNTGTKTPDNTTTETATTQTATAGGLLCTRKITANGSDYNVELTIKRGNISGFAKLQENIPAGLTASAVQSTGAAFSFADQKVKLVWVNLPNDAEFRVAYKLTGKTTTGNVDGVLSYIENDETKKYEISPSSLAGTANTNVVAENNTNQNTNTTATDPTKIDNNTTTTNNNTTTTNTTTNDNKPDLTKNTTPTANTAVNYKVQVCALRENRVESSYFTNRFSLSGVSAELHEGWTKYIVGGFNEYKQARDYREDVRSKGVSGPFVTAYNSGKRITVQEALMITTQQWYK